MRLHDKAQAARRAAAANENDSNAAPANAELPPTSEPSSVAGADDPSEEVSTGAAGGTGAAKKGAAAKKGREAAEDAKGAPPMAPPGKARRR